MKILKTNQHQTKTVSFKAPASLVQRLQSLSERAKARGLYLPIDDQLTSALTRIVKAGEHELEEIELQKQGGGDA